MDMGLLLKKINRVFSVCLFIFIVVVLPAATIITLIVFLRGIDGVIVIVLVLAGMAVLMGVFVGYRGE